MKIKILTDTSCGLTQKECLQEGYELIGLPFFIDGVEYNDLSLDKATFYKKLKECKTITTSQASIETVTNKFDELLKENDYVLYCPITSGLSSAYNNGCIAASDEKYKDRVVCIDHKTISVPQVAMLKNIKELIDKSYKPDKIKEVIETNKKNSIWLIPDTLDLLRKGGRLNSFSATIGNLLNIKPLLFTTGDRFDIIKKERGMKRVLEELSRLVETELTNKFGKDSSLAIGVAYSGDDKLALEIQNKLINKYSDLKVTYIIGELPPVIECHTGLDAIGVAIYSNVIC